MAFEKNQNINLIKRKVNIFDVCNIFKLKIYSGNKINSPYNADKNPSCSLYSADNSFYDFSAGKGGDVVNLYAALANCSVKEAIDALLSMIVLTPDTPKSYSPIEKKETIGTMSELEKDIWNEGPNDEIAMLNIKKHRYENNVKIYTELYNYCKDNMTYGAKEYLIKERCLSQDTIDRFKLFLIYDYHRINNHLKKVFELTELQISGLYNEKGNLIFAKHRIVIPYLWQGKISYMRGRFFDENNCSKTDEWKYLGLRKDSLSVNTTKRFFNLTKLLPETRVFLVEGEFDAMVLENLGFRAIGIPGANNIPFDKLHQLIDYNIVIVCDNDVVNPKTGKKVGEEFKREIKNFFLTNYNKSVKEYNIPLQYKDMTDFVRAVGSL